MGQGVRKAQRRQFTPASFFLSFLTDSYTVGIQQTAQREGSQTGPLPSGGMWSNGMADTNQPVT